MYFEEPKTKMKAFEIIIRATTNFYLFSNLILFHINVYDRQ